MHRPFKNLEIAPYRPRHLRRILEIERASFPKEPYTRRTFEELCTECGDLFLVGKVCRRIVAYIATRLSEGRAEVVSIAVAPEYRSAGAGTALLANTIERLREAGANSVELMVRVDNRDAIRFYRRFGFRRAGRVAGYYEDGRTGLRMKLTLAGYAPARE